MSGAIMNKIWGAFGMDADENEEEEYEEVEENENEEENSNKENRIWGRKNNSKVVSMPQAQQVRMVISQPTTFDQAEDICDLLKEKQSVIVNLEYVNKDYIVINEEENISKEEKLDFIFNNFHKMVKCLRGRYNNRNTIDVQDEYDVQDLLFAVLQLFFEDIRKEEWTPSYAGNCSRVDFLLKKEKIVIEVKKTRSSMKDKDLGEQLIIDIERYKVHPDCKQLICFVYDPEGRIVNPIGIVNDLENNNKDFVKVYINPK